MESLSISIVIIALLITLHNVLNSRRYDKGLKEFAVTMLIISLFAMIALLYVIIL